MIQFRSLDFILLVLCASLSAIALARCQLSCMDENGKPVDWFMAYKFPRLSDGQFATGHAYAYFTNEDVGSNQDQYVPQARDSESSLFLYRFRDLLFRYIGNPFRSTAQVNKRKRDQLRRKSVRQNLPFDNQRWQVSDKLIGDPKSIVMQTLAAAYDNNSGHINSVFYNDDPPAHPDAEEEMTKNNRRAHAKGVLLMDETTGDSIWLTHSVPRFPPTRDQKLKFMNNVAWFGQTFMCVSFNFHQSGKQIVDHLVNMRPQVYDHRVSDYMYKQIPDLDYLGHEENSKYRKVPVVPKLSQMVTTKAGQVLQLYSKSLAFGKDIYDGYIDTEIKSALYVETWRRGNGNPLNSTCPHSEYHVNNVNELKYNTTTYWTYQSDHSKWAISDEEDKGIVCLSDINRMQSQFKRGGGAVCMKCPTCWKVFSNTIREVEPCPKQSVKPSRNQVEDRSLLRRIASAFA